MRTSLLTLARCASRRLTSDHVAPRRGLTRLACLLHMIVRKTKRGTGVGRQGRPHVPRDPRANPTHVVALQVRDPNGLFALARHEPHRSPSEDLVRLPPAASCGALHPAVVQATRGQGSVQQAHAVRKA